MITNKGNGDSEGLKELFIDEIKDIYWAEKAMTKALPKMSKKASDDNLVNALESHLSETENHVARLEKIFQILSLKPQAKKCPAMAGLIEEADEIMSETEEGPIRDAGIISAAQKVEHYEIATYGTLRAFAEKLKLSKVAGLLEDTLKEEKKLIKL
ncbi:MAG TPA: ferritin-like domain-containing protein [Bacteroidia bacterium]|jgi:ferritin-like metal-binding protein YciE|nr:ferritin-like domain-containing protein [Bacteroidia bacterium]